jgi:signal transduction histidine kinase
VEPREEVYVTFSYAPVFGDGAVGGIFWACWETTQRLVGTRRLDTLRKLGVRLAEARTVPEAWAAAAVVLAENPHDVPFAAVYAVNDDGATADVRGMTGPSPGHTPLPARVALDDGYRTLFDLVAGHLGTAFAEATAFEAERRRAEALTEIDRAKTAFFSNVSHEFRSPLTLMLAPLEEALASRSLAAEHREQLTTAHRSAARLLKLVNSLLDFARIEAGRVEAFYEATEIGTLTSEVVSNFRSVSERAGLRLTVACPALPEPVYVDRDMREKIVVNLVSNAFKFTLHGEITVALDSAARATVLTVRDTGTGISADQLPHVFERFHRVPGARARSPEGAGIGLALVHELVRLHDGAVTVASALDRGTTFTVRSRRERRICRPLGSMRCGPVSRRGSAWRRT